MKLILTINFSLILSLYTFSQDCRPANEFEKEEIAVFDSLYPSAMHIDSTIAVFKGREEEFFKAWSSFLQDFGKHLSENNFYWSEPTRCFNRVYFKKDGTVDTFLFNFKEGDLNKEQQYLFKTLLKNFSKDYKLKLQSEAKSNFSQCGPALYK